MQQKDKQVTDQKSLMDIRTVHSMLMKTRIPQKRTNQQRKAAYRDDDSDEDSDNQRDTQNDTRDDEIMPPPVKRQKSSGMEFEYDSPAEDIPMNPVSE